MGGPAREVKIDAGRLQDTENNEWDEESETRRGGSPEAFPSASSENYFQQDDTFKNDLNS